MPQMSVRHAETEGSTKSKHLDLAGRLYLCYAAGICYDGVKFLLNVSIVK